MSEVSEDSRIKFTDWRYNTVAERPGGFFSKRHFGIRAVGRAPNGWQMIEIIHNISAERIIADRITQFFNEHRLTPDLLRRPGTLISDIERCSAQRSILGN